MRQDPPRRTLATLVADTDRLRFTGRDSELAFLDRCLDGAGAPASVVHVCGPGGIGKSAVLREIARRARERGRTVVALDGRELGPQLAALESAAAGLAGAADPVLLLDSCELVTGLDQFLRAELLPGLPERSLVVLARRGDPPPGWFSGGWEAVTAQLDLRAMSAGEARQLLAACGVADGRVPSIIDWAAGSPLALALAGDAAAADAGWDAASAPDRPEIIRSLLRRLTDTELANIKPSALGVAVVARCTTPGLLRAVLPGEDADAAYAQLARLTVAEPLGGGIVLHELVRRALAANLRRDNPDLERDLRRKIADYLCGRAAAEPVLVLDIAHLVDNPMVKWGFGWDGQAGVRLDFVRPGDADRARPGPDDSQAWFELSHRYFTDAPGRVSVARDDAGQICGYMVVMSLATAPSFAWTDPLTGAWLEQAKRDAHLGDSIIWQSAVDLSGEGKVQSILGVAGTLRSGAVSPRFGYLPIDARLPAALDFARAAGARHLPELDVAFGDVPVQCWRIDYGPGGLFDTLRRLIYKELGLPRPQPLTPPAPAVTSEPPPAAGQSDSSLEQVREALRNFHIAAELARSPLARGQGVADRAESVRRLLTRATAEAFGETPAERLLASVLRAGYLEAASGHEAAAARLNLSRASYFRRLRTAVRRLADHIAAAGAEPEARPAGAEHAAPVG